MPTLGEVMSDIDQHDEAQAALGPEAVEAARTTDALLKTRLKAPAELFAKFVRGLEAAARSAAHAEAASKGGVAAW